MHKITESFGNRTIEIESPNIFDTALSISDFVKSLSLGKVSVIDHSFKTDGPTDVVKLIFDIRKNFDSRTNAIINFSIFGNFEKVSQKKGILNVKIKGSMETTMAPEQGIATKALDEYYLKNIYKILIEKTKDTYDYTVKRVKKEFS